MTGVSPTGLSSLGRPFLCLLYPGRPWKQKLKGLAFVKKDLENTHMAKADCRAQLTSQGSYFHLVFWFKTLTFLLGFKMIH